jgi:hypothetical protein
MQSNGRTVRQLKQSQSTSQLMKTNKSLTSSPCDDMNTVLIAEQKAKDSVGKENGMNLSDHESIHTQVFHAFLLMIFFDCHSERFLPISVMHLSDSLSK